MKGIKRTGFLAKIVILALLIYLSVTLLTLGSKINATQDEVDRLTEQVEAQAQSNAELQDAIDNSGDRKQIEDVAREKLGLVEPNEKVFYIVD